MSSPVEKTLNGHGGQKEAERFKYEPIILDRFQIINRSNENSFNSRLDEETSPNSSSRKRNFRAFLLGEVSPVKFISPYTYRHLKPYIWRDFESQPKKLQLLQQIVAYPNLENMDWLPEVCSIDYCYLRQSFSNQVNSLLCDNFWPGIDISECHAYPDYTICALYKRTVIGCAFMTPEAYILYIVVHPEWRGAGIATFMLYHLIQTISDKDITLHVSVTNSALLLYQKFGFKPEQFIVGFYKRYYSDDSKECKNAFFLRLRR